MQLFTKKLNRKMLVDKLSKFRSSNKYEDKGYFLDYIDIIKNEFSRSKFVSDSDFLVKGRRKFLVEEFYQVLKNENDYNKTEHIKDPLYFALGNIEEILQGNNMVHAEDVDKDKWTINEDGNYTIDGKYVEELRSIDDRYAIKKIICLEEKEMIEEMINALQDAIDNN